jgi:hypothetical protein
MHKTFWQILITATFILTACGQSTPLPVIDNASSTPSPLPTATPTRTALPSTTPTASITPLPTIPTFTPTFDVSTIVTVTPAPKAECPTENLQKQFVFDRATYDPNFSRKILDFLNSGGSRRSVVVAYQQAYQWANNSVIQEKDVTGDKDPELLFTELGFFYIYTCNHGQYKIKVPLAETYRFTQPSIVEVQDLNRDGLVEIIAMEGDDRVRIVSVFEWDGNDFKVLNPTFNTMYGPSGVETLDTNGDGILELIFKQAIPIWSEYYDGLPWRKEKRIFVWDGQQFSLSGIELDSPEYRFQAIQDGDVATSQNDFSKALHLYQEAINNKRLHSFSPEIRQNLRANLDSQIGPNPLPSPTPYPSDATEYSKLATYAYFRIMLLQFVQGNKVEAETTYKTLQQKFDSKPYSRPYVEMATAFWNAYQSTHKMYDGCAAAIQYAAEHPDILIPLGSDYHGSQSHQYKPEDVCPFR